MPLLLDMSTSPSEQSRLEASTTKLHRLLAGYKATKCDPCKIIAIVRNASCCFRCSLRMLGCRESELYILTDQVKDLDGVETNQENARINRTYVVGFGGCSCCF
jgi:hypothetical protein